MTMTQPAVLSQNPPEFERFLYATVGEDRNGSVVTVLSTLARLGLDPWNETAELVTLGRDAAGTRLGILLSRFRDVPALGSTHGRVARELSLLLPEGPPARALQQAASKASGGRLRSSGAIWAMIAVFFILMQVLFSWLLGSGE